MRRESDLDDRSGQLEQKRQPDGSRLIEGYVVRPLTGRGRRGGIRRTGWSVAEVGPEPGPVLTRRGTLTEARDFIRAQKGL
jgi:hypothetical protein